MAHALEPYTLQQAQDLVDDAVRRARPRHMRWNVLEHMFRTGMAEGSVSSADLPGTLFRESETVLLEVINYILPHLSMIIETVAARDPELVVEPYRGGDDIETRARIAEVTLRYWWARLDVTPRVLRDMTQDAVVLGNGFGKVGWAFGEEESDRDPAEVAHELADLLEADRRDATLDERDPTPVDELADRVSLTEMQATVDEPWVEYVSPYDMFVPENARRLDESPWVAQRLVLPLDQVQANDQFDEDAVADLTTIRIAEESTEHRRDEGSSTYQQNTDVFAHVELFEFHDLRTRRLVIFQANSEKPLFEGELPHSHRHTQFVHLRNFNDGGSRFWCFGDLENVAPIQHQLNEYIAEQMDNARRSGNKTLIDDRLVTDETREALESDDSDVVVPVNTGGQQLSDMVHNVERKGLSTDVYAAKDDLRAALSEVLGLSDFQTGGMGADRMSATAAAVVEGTSVLRAAGKREQVEHAAARIGLLLLLLCQEFLAPDTAVRVAGPGGAAWVNVGYEDLRGEYAVRVRVGSTEAVNPSTRQRRAMETLSTVIPALAADGYDTEPMWRHVIRDLGYDPQHVLKRDAAMAPEGAGGPPGEGLPADPPQMGALADLGAPPVPAAVEGGPIA